VARDIDIFWFLADFEYWLIPFYPPPEKISSDKLGNCPKRRWKSRRRVLNYFMVRSTFYQARKI